MYFKEEQYAKHQDPMDVTLSGMVIFSNSLQLEKADVPIFVIDIGIFTSTIEELLKA